MPLVEENLFNISNTAYQKAIDSQFKSVGVEFGKKNQAFIDEFKTNAAVFAAFKNHRQTTEIAGQLMDENGKLRTFHEFQKAVLGTSIKADYNKRWLLTEYNMAVRSARVASRWKKFEETKHIFPNLEFMPSTAANPREEHKEYYGTILPIDHTWWNDHTPPLDWGCECGIRNTDKPVSKVPADAEPIDPIFDNNPGKTAEIVNMGEHPYVKGVCNVYATCPFRKQLNLAEFPNRPECKVCEMVYYYKTNLKRKEDNKRIFEKIVINKSYFNVKYDQDTGGLKATHVDHNFDKAKGYREKEVQDVGFKYGRSVILESEKGKGLNEKYTDILGLFKKVCQFLFSGFCSTLPEDRRSKGNVLQSYKIIDVSHIFLQNNPPIPVAQPSRQMPYVSSFSHCA